MSVAPLITISYEGGSYHVAYGIRPENDPNREAGFNEIMGGLAIAAGLVMSRVAHMDPEYMGGESMQATKDAFWKQVENTIDQALTGEVERG